MALRDGTNMKLNIPASKGVNGLSPSKTQGCLIKTIDVDNEISHMHVARNRH